MMFFVVDCDTRSGLIPISTSFVVQFARHRENEPMLDDGILRRGRIFSDVLERLLRNASLALVIGRLSRRGAAAVLIDQD